MSENDWLSLKIGDMVNSLNSQYCQGLIVSEICTDAKSLSHWENRGFTNLSRLIKFVKEGTNFHTWDASPDSWSKV